MLASFRLLQILFRGTCKTGFRRIAPLACGLMLSSANATASFDELVVVKSSDNPYYEQTITSLAGHIDSKMRLRVVDANRLPLAKPERGIRRLFIALGNEAVLRLRTTAPNAALVSAYLTLEQYRLLADDNHFAVLLDQPLQRYLAFCKLMLDLDSVGVIEPHPIAADASLSRTLARFALQLNQFRIDADNKLLPVLRDLLASNDALLMLPRSAVYNRDSLKGVLLTSYRNGKPAISYSPAHVKAGALASIYSSPIDIGRHLALVVERRSLSSAGDASGYEFAKFYSISSNQRVARTLNVTLPDAAELRKALDRVKL